MEKEKIEHKQQVEQLNSVISKIENELSICQTNFSNFKKKTQIREDDLFNDIVELEHKLKDFQNVVYKTGESITTIQKFTINPNPKGNGIAIGHDQPCYLHKALKAVPKLYNAQALFDSNVVNVVIYNRDYGTREFDYDDDSESRSKMANVFYNKPFDYSKYPPLYDTFHSHKEFTELPSCLPHIDEPTPVSHVAQVNGPLPSDEKVAPLPKDCRIMRYFKTFMDDIKFLEDIIASNSEIKVSTFMSPQAKEHRNVFQKQVLPHVQHLRQCATMWEQELQTEVTSMIHTFNATENSISKHKKKNKLLLFETDRLLEDVINRDIMSVIMNSM